MCGLFPIPVLMKYSMSVPASFLKAPLMSHFVPDLHPSKSTLANQPSQIHLIKTPNKFMKNNTTSKYPSNTALSSTSCTPPLILPTRYRPKSINLPRQTSKYFVSIFPCAIARTTSTSFLSPSLSKTCLITPEKYFQDEDSWVETGEGEALHQKDKEGCFRGGRMWSHQFHSGKQKSDCASLQSV
ncbi:hypothetical protein BDZ45DRAFT_97266 [Acephala macrosclerotiorum]|nr:hypothetical protein BDZ45DRAFT_97266 [Acephala macrosclerotiorum]